MAKVEEKEIKAGAETTPKEVKTTPKEENSDGMVKVDPNVLKELIAQNKEFQKSIIELQKNAVAQTPNTGTTMMKTSNKETLIKIKYWNGKLFLGYENVGTEKKPVYVYSEYNALTRENIQFCNVILEGEDKPLKLTYVDFLRESEKVLVKLKKKIEMEDKITNQGFIQKKDFAENGYGMFETMVQVPVEVIEKQYAYVVELENGSEVELPEQAIQ